MEAKDTVIPVPSHSESIWCPHCGDEFGIESKVEYEREAQAEISFKAGVKLGYTAGKLDGQFTNHLKHSKEMAQAKLGGVKEVVEWIKTHKFGGSKCETVFYLANKEWQAFLKSKEVENG